MSLFYHISVLFRPCSELQLLLCKDMIIISIALSFITALIEFIERGKMIIIIPYGLVVPFFLLLPRLIYTTSVTFKKLVNVQWLNRIEQISFVILLLNAPASLILHDLGFQYDRFLHFAGGALVFAIAVLIYLPIDKKIFRGQTRKMRVLVVSFGVILVGVFIWEGYQYVADALFGTNLFSDAVQEINVDFWEDIIFGELGIITAFVYFKHQTRWYKILKKNAAGEGN